MEIILKGRPLSTNNVYATMCRGNFPNRYMTSAGKQLKESYQWQAKSQWKKKLIEEDLKINIKLYFDSNRKHDIDNYHKISFDALTGIVWKDDNQISEMTVNKFTDKNNPRIEIEIYELKRN